jgi:pimeloyl-ACP methyl ester carboxylesterase
MSVRKLAFQTRGRGRPVLLVHGFPFHRGQWDGLVDELARHAFVITADLRGFGESAFERGFEAGASTMEQHADDLAAALDEAGVKEPVTFVGFSMGGYVAFPFFQRHRQRLAALALCNTRAIADTPEGAAGRATMAAKVLAEGPKPLVDGMLPKLLAPDTLAKRPDVVERVRALMQAPREAIAAALHGMAQRPDSTPLLARIDVPTLVVVGEHDAISSPTEMRSIAGSIRGSRFVQLAGAGHMTTHETPRELSIALVEFIRSL